MTTQQTQMALNGYAFNTASLLSELAGTVDYSKLKEIVTSFGKLSKAPSEQINKALFWASNHFNCTVK